MNWIESLLLGLLQGLTEYLPISRLASGISIYALAQSFAQVIGPAAGLWLVEAVGFSPAYFLAAGCLLVAMTGVLFLKEPVRERLPYQFKLNRMFAREAVSKAAVLMLLSISFACMTSYLVLYGYLRGIENMGVYFTVYAISLLATRPVFGKLADHWGAPRVLIIGALPVLRYYGYGPLPVNFAGKAATLCLLYAFPLLFLGGYSGAVGYVAQIVGWAFAIWGTALYWWAGLLYSVQGSQLIRQSRALEREEDTNPGRGQRTDRPAPQRR